VNLSEYMERLEAALSPLSGEERDDFLM